jgi:hypothetical protein
MKGFPLTFRCGKCRSTLNPETDTGRAGRVDLTGRTKPYAKGGRCANRHADGASREYRCLDCGHVGWSSHRDLIRAAARTNSHVERS